MNGDTFTPFHYGVFDPTQTVRFPEHLQTMIAGGVGNSRASYNKVAQYAKDNLKTADKIVTAAQASGKEIGEKVLALAEINVRATFEAAAAFSRARTLPELARLQTNFAQQQLAVAHAQTQDLFQLSSQLVQQTFAAINSAIARNFEQPKKID